MGLAVITIFCNESFRIPKWQEYYSEYKSEVRRHIIVDNNSTDEETEKVRVAFPEARHIKLDKNGGVTAAYNAGVREALSEPAVNAVMLVCNDIKISAESVRAMRSALDAEKQIGMATPVLLKKDSEIIEDGGCTISFCLFMKPQHVGETLEDLEKKNIIVKSVTGGVNLASREFYELVGEQDEQLFMYSDEIDVGIKAEKAGFKMVMVRNAKAWHQHENPPGKKRRSTVSDYLMARNKVYLAKKYYGSVRMLLVFLFFVFFNLARYIVWLIKGRDTAVPKQSMRGAVDGLKGRMGKPEL